MAGRIVYYSCTPRFDLLLSETLGCRMLVSGWVSGLSVLSALVDWRGTAEIPTLWGE
jgi:hypothetical protein